MHGEPVIPAPEVDDDDDVAWALQTAAVQWQRGQRADAVVWLRRAVEASISTARPERTRELTRLAASVADRLVTEALAVPDSRAPPPAEADTRVHSDVDELLARPSGRPSSVRPRPSQHSASEIPVDFEDDAELLEDDFEEDLSDEDGDESEDRVPTLPPRAPAVSATDFRQELSSRDYEYEDSGVEHIEDIDDGATLALPGKARGLLEDEDTESLVEPHELLSDRPPGPSGYPASRRPSGAPPQRAPSEYPAQRPPSNRPQQRAPSGAPVQRAPSDRPPQRAPSEGPFQRSPSDRAARPSSQSPAPRGSDRARAGGSPSSRAPEPQADQRRGGPGRQSGNVSGRTSDRTRLESGGTYPGGFAADDEQLHPPRQPASRAPASSGRPPGNARQSSGAPARGSDRAPGVGARAPSSNAPARGSDRAPVSSGRAREMPERRPPSAPPPSDAQTAPSERPRPSSDRPMEPIVTAEELFRQKALENAQKSEPPPPPAGSSSEPPPADAVVDGIRLDSVRGFEDLPEPAQLALAKTASVTMLAVDEEVGSFGAALVTKGRVGIMPAIADVASSVAKAGDVVFTKGTLADGVSLRVVALEGDTAVASWTDLDLRAAMADCPWVADELRLVADRFQAQAGAVLGPLGDRLDDVLRDLVMSRLEVKAYEAGEVIVEEGKPVPGLHIVGGGRVELAPSSGKASEASPGQFLFAAEVLGGGRAKATARAGKGGALVLFTPRSVAHELLLSVPTLIEILSE